MDNIEVESHGKINLSLDVLYKRDDGYHEIDTIMQEISLKDNLIIENNSRRDISIKSNRKDIPLGSSNLVYKAWEKVRQETGIQKGINVYIEKNIPVAAGLAGGSSNAAATLNALNSLWNLQLEDADLHRIALDIGADVPYCLVGGTARAKGVGEKLTRLKPLSKKHLLLFNPGIKISTVGVYKNLKPGKFERVDINKLVGYIEKDDIYSLAGNMRNIMEKTVVGKYPVVGRIKEKMEDLGAIGSLMSGSGSTVFGIFDDLDKLINCKEKLEKFDGSAIHCETL